MVRKGQSLFHRGIPSSDHHNLLPAEEETVTHRTC